MSRCFPYPPPYYEQSLIESIKLQKGRERARKEEKEKTEKKEKSKAKKEKEKEKEKKREKNREKDVQKPVNSQHEEKRHKKRKYEEKTQKTRNDAIEQLERSGLTEEHELPCSIRHKHDSPESSQDSNKRRKLVPQSVSSHGNIVRIKLPFLRHGDSDLVSVGRVDSELPLPSLKRRDLEPPAIEAVGQVVVPVAKPKQIVEELPGVDEQPCFSGRDAEAPFPQAAAVPSHRSSSSKRIGGRTWQREQFRDLIGNWNPPQLRYESSGTADDWLVGAPKQPFSLRSCANKCEVSREGLSCGNYALSSQQPRACYLPELDMYQLPYVIPF